MLAGNVTGLLSPLVFVPVLTFGFGRQNYDWESMKAIRRVDDSEIIRRTSIDAEMQRVATDRIAEQEAAEETELKRSAFIARSLTVVLILAMLILWPMPLYGTGYIFSKKFFTGTLPRSIYIDWKSWWLTLSSLHRLGRCRHHLALLQYRLRWPVPSLARPQDHCSHSKIDGPRHGWEETTGSQTPFDGIGGRRVLKPSYAARESGREVGLSCSMNLAGVVSE